MRLPQLLTAVAALACVAGAARAQRADRSAYAQRASLALLGVPFGFLSGEYERALSDELSLGAAAGYDEFEDDREAWGDLKVRYYPSARALRGFAIGALAGAARLDPRDDFGDFVDPAAVTRARSAATAGVFIDYSWLLGRRHRFYVGTGLGAKRVLGLGDDPNDEYPDAIGFGRLQIGYAF